MLVPASRVSIAMLEISPAGEALHYDEIGSSA